MPTAYANPAFFDSSDPIAQLQAAAAAGRPDLRQFAEWIGMTGPRLITANANGAAAASDALPATCWPKAPGKRTSRPSSASTPNWRAPACSAAEYLKSTASCCFNRESTGSWTASTSRGGTHEATRHAIPPHSHASGVRHVAAATHTDQPGRRPVANPSCEDARQRGAARWRPLADARGSKALAHCAGRASISRSTRAAQGGIGPN